MTRSGYFADRVVVVVFEFCGAAVTQGAVQPGAVVPGDVLHDRAAGRRPGGPCLVAGELAFERGEKALRYGVIPALALAADRQDDLAVTGQGGERGGCVLAAPVGMEDHPG